NVGSLTRDQACELLKMPATRLDFLQNDDALSWLLDWPLGASLLAAAVERYTVEAGSPGRGWELVMEHLRRSGRKLLDRPGTPGRNGSVSSSLRESLGRLLPDERRLLLDIARGGSSRQGAETLEARRLRDLGLVNAGRDGLRVHEVIYGWLLGQG